MSLLNIYKIEKTPKGHQANQKINNNLENSAPKVGEWLKWDINESWSRIYDVQNETYVRQNIEFVQTNLPQTKF